MMILITSLSLEDTIEIILIPRESRGYFYNIDSWFESSGYYLDNIDTREGRRLIIMMIVLMRIVMISYDINYVLCIHSIMCIIYHQYTPMSISWYGTVA